MARNDGLTLVYWKQDEKLQLARQVAETRPNKRWMLSAVRDAQSVLPPNRRRNITSLADVPWWDEIYSAACKAADRALAKQQREAVPMEVKAEPPVPEPASPVDNAPLLESPKFDTIADPVPTSEPPAAPPPILAGFLKLRDLLVDELASVFVEAGLKAMGSLAISEEPATASIARTASGDRRIVVQRPPPRPKLLIVGIKKGELRQQIEREFSARFDLRFHHDDESKEHLKALADSAERAIVMTGWVSHATSDIVKARTRRHLLLPTAAGMTQLRETLSTLTN